MNIGYTLKEIDALEEGWFFYDHAWSLLFEIIKKIGKKYYLPRGKSISAFVSDIKSKKLKKTTLGGCVIQKVSETVAFFPERS